MHMRHAAHGVTDDNTVDRTRRTERGKRVTSDYRSDTEDEAAGSESDGERHKPAADLSHKKRA